MAAFWICKAKGPLLVLLFHLMTSLVHATTNEPDVSALRNLFTSMNSAKQLKSWSSNGTDPCGDMWEGVTCVGEAVTQIHLPGFNLTGNLGYRLDQLTSLTSLDLSNNQLSGSLPYQLPPSLQQLNLGRNNFSGSSGSFPYSFMSMNHLTYLNMSNNQFSGSISDVFGHFKELDVLDLSFNTFSGGLPQSFSNLSTLSVMHLQNNSFSGNLSILADLPLRDLNVENNKFTGWIPSTFSSISNLKLGGNNFNIGPASSPTTLASPPRTASSVAPDSNGPSIGNDQKLSPISSPTTLSDSNSSLSTGAIAGIAIGGILAVSISAFVIAICSLKDSEKLGGQEEHRLETAPANWSLTVPPARVSNYSQGKPSPAKEPTALSLSDLQVATNSFHEENIIGESSFGSLYKGTLQDKVVAVKHLNASDLQFPQAENMKGLLFQIASLHHPNITQLVGYCIHHGQCLLVYEYHSRGTLHEILHSDGGTGKVLSWDGRVKVALGAARALEFLHESCMSPIVHKNFTSVNIWLDEELSPHLAESGIAAFCPPLGQQASVPVTGSFSYSAPEHIMSGIYSTKSDVYSFGVVMLELLTGRKPFDSTKPRNQKSLVRWAMSQLHDIDALISMVDPRLMGEYPVKSISGFADIISQCLQPEPEFRPLMSEVVQAFVRLMERAKLMSKNE